MRRAAAAALLVLSTIWALAAFLHALSARPAEPEPALECTPGTFEDASQWTGLFPGRLPLRGKALVAIPIGGRPCGSQSFQAAFKSGT